MPHVRKELEAESCPSEMSRDFIPRGSVQPAVFELTVNPGQTEGGSEENPNRGKEKEQGEMNTPREKRTFTHHAFEGNQKYGEQFGTHPQKKKYREHAEYVHSPLFVFELLHSKTEGGRNETTNSCFCLCEGYLIQLHPEN